MLGKRYFAYEVIERKHGVELSDNKRYRSVSSFKLEATSRTTVVKESDIANTPAGLMARLEAIIDSPTVVGALSSKLQSGRASDIAEVRRAVELAELRRGRGGR